MIITDQAKSYIEKMMKENGESNLRFTFEGAGCCGPNFGVTLSEQQEDDKVEIINGINVSVDNRVIDATRNITLDFEGTEEDAGLVLQNNNSSC
ncbi:adhesin [Virgibacillus pantothenticus]|uniref:iron-sulfur cluster biosynthesis family protein n=1 Tax=Virgibacillus pantothenticus TaxID=1473 RepID=UPI001C21758E|nr:iron-sulfur cluster biosynthesis family protein [Virgibacillus pantothenticus]MBU8567148.1 adhesin [Virgibacillus pantothenticus]MBU8600820.1 adhesin [Virgibacillus pantothenticus]MBU8635300.1 adhesin [Virgibacillus pantothenticus]MBU8643000.1 adhesin [Virgibacillus pantothenticus]MBU8646980.1 adhesin [Virgibacillus pantothenticus]